MMRKIIRRYLPDAAQTHPHPPLRLFGHWLQPANLWHRNRRAVPGAVGLFRVFIQSPTQMLPAAASAIALRVNLPLSLARTWIANPLDRLFPVTAPCVALPPHVHVGRRRSLLRACMDAAPCRRYFYFNYRNGTWLLDRAERSFSIELS